MKDDYLEIVNGDLTKSNSIYNNDISFMKHISQITKCVYYNTDINDLNNMENLFRILK